MLTYLINLGFVWIMCVLANRFGRGNTEYENIRKPNGLFVFFAFISLFLVCGLRWNVGTDYGSYTVIYSANMTKSFLQVISAEEPLFILITWICSRNGYHPEVMFLVCTAITTGLMVVSIREYSSIFELGMFLYITDMTYYSQFNGMRQSMAGAIMFLAFRNLVQGNFKKYLIAIIIASNIHTSAMFFIPVYFLVRLKPWSKRIFFIAGVFFMAFMFFPQVMEILSHTVDGRYQMYFNLSGVYSSYGVKPIRVVVAAVPVIISYIFYGNLRNKSADTDILINLSFLNLLFMFIASKNVSLSRICMYLAPYNLLLIPQFVGIDKTKTRYLIYIGIMLAFIMYMIVLLPVESNLLPYRTIFSR